MTIITEVDENFLTKILYFKINSIVKKYFFKELRPNLLGQLSSNCISCFFPLTFSGSSLLFLDNFSILHGQCQLCESFPSNIPCNVQHHCKSYI